MRAALEIPGVEATIETPEQARSHARRWRRMAEDIKRSATTEEELAKARELNQRAEATYRWAREQERDDGAAGAPGATLRPQGAAQREGSPGARRARAGRKPSGEAGGQSGKAALAALGLGLLAFAAWKKLPRGWRFIVMVALVSAGVVVSQHAIVLLVVVAGVVGVLLWRRQQRRLPAARG